MISQNSLLITIEVACVNLELLSCGSSYFIITFFSCGMEGESCSLLMRTMLSCCLKDVSHGWMEPLKQPRLDVDDVRLDDIRENEFGYEVLNNKKGTIGLRKDGISEIKKLTSLEEITDNSQGHLFKIFLESSKFLPHL